MVKTEERWLTINGRKLLTRTLISELDWSFKGIIPKSANQSDAYMDACHMLYGVQMAADAYWNGKTEIDDGLAERIKEELLSVPFDRSLPDAVEILFNEMCREIGLSNIQSSKWLDNCEKCSETKMNEILEEKKKEEERIRLVDSLEIKGNQNAEQASRLMEFLAAKHDWPEYKLKQKEVSATRLWCD